MKLTLLKVGYCCHPEAIAVRGGSWKPVQFPAVVGVLQHPTQGVILFDTGYAPHFTDATQPFPERLYRWVTPMHLSEQQHLHHQLAQRNIALGDVRYIFISHFHADHIAGLKDFSNARFFCSRQALIDMQKRSRIGNLLHGHLPALLPNNFVQRAQFIEDSPNVSLSKTLTPFATGKDLFQDGSLLAIALPGHASGHYGLLIHQPNSSCFLIGDACWSINTLQGGNTPHPISKLILDNSSEYYATQQNLTQLHSGNQNIQIIPSHCTHSYEAFIRHAD
ncbi:MBL fold metallo-hydrolase [Teredinibacter sp. KSP-S5-2]|uniref:MBL fold metallo-hydrolase n=1 Tax=Teredinibacter sp. KSP-S5-2 TaxID=3034506 RepID=UPI0029345003|nr:MBL fold metallo-hydrolase [Teredinibacter sp. KSP-S5-2]WNO08301.1 MBL fold metallo-hydrolase [Teredinibacter sp. KSP-S5-2]